MYQFNTDNKVFNNFLNRQFKFFASTIKPCFLEEKYTIFQSDKNIIKYIKPKEDIISFLEKTPFLKEKLNKHTDEVAENLNDNDYLNFLTNTINKLYDNSFHTPNIRDMYALYVILDLATRYIHFSSKERLDIMIGLTKDFSADEMDEFVDETSRLMEEFDCKNMTEFAGNVLTSWHSVHFLFENPKALIEIVDLNYFKDEFKGIDMLIEEGKSFKEINKYYIDIDER